MCSSDLEIVTCILLLLKRPTISQLFQFRSVCGIFFVNHLAPPSINRDVKISFLDLEFMLLLLNLIAFIVSIVGVFEQLARYTMRYQESDFTSWPLFFLIFLQLLLTLLLLYFSLLTSTSSSIVAVLIAKAGHVWVS